MLPQIIGLIMTVQIVKFMSGEEVIGKVSDLNIEGRNVVKLEKPAIIIMSPVEGQKDKFGIGMAPYAPYAEGNVIHVLPHGISALMQPTDELMNEYNEHYGDGIFVPQKPKIVT